MATPESTNISVYDAVAAALMSGGNCITLLPSVTAKNNYDLAVENGFVGTVSEWLESLKGEISSELLLEAETAIADATAAATRAKNIIDGFELNGVSTTNIFNSEGTSQETVNLSKLNKVATFGSATTDVLYRKGINYESRAVTPETANWTPQYDGWNNGIVEKLESRTWYHDFRPTIADGADFNTDGCNFFMGPGAGNLTMRPDKTAIGDYKLHTSHNYGIGLQALGALTTGYKNTAFGTNAGRRITQGFYNTAVGRDPMHNLTTGHSNTFMGMTSGYGVETGNYNSYYGTQSGYNNLVGSGNVKFGGRCAFDMTSGDNNVFLGYQAAVGQLSGTRNIAIGYQSTNNGITSGSYNTLIGGFISGLDNVSYQVVLADGNGNIILHSNPGGTKPAKLDIVGRDATAIDLAALDNQEGKGTTFKLFNTSNANSFAQILMQSRTGQAVTRLIAWGSQAPKWSFIHNKIESLRIEADSSVQLKTGTSATAALASKGMMGFELVDNTTLKIKVKGTDDVTRSVLLTLS